MSRCIRAGGLLIVLAVLAILAVITAEILPLFAGPTATPSQRVAAGSASQPLALRVDEQLQLACVVTESGLHVLGLKDGAAVTLPQSLEIAKAPIVCAHLPASGDFALGLAAGQALTGRLVFATGYADGQRTVTPEISFDAPVVLDEQQRAVRHVARAVTERHEVLAACTQERAVILLEITRKKNLMGQESRRAQRREIPLQITGEITALALDERAEDLIVGSSAGELVRVPLEDGGAGPQVSAVFLDEQQPCSVTSLCWLLGDRTLAVGDARGGVSTWHLSGAGQTGPAMRRIHDFDRHRGPVVSMARSQRDKGFTSAESDGTLKLHYATTGVTLLTVRHPGAVSVVSVAPKADALVACGGDGEIATWALHNAHPEVTLSSLFGRVWYEGYEQPEFVWQSTGGTDDFEAKYSLVPLLFGTLKGTFYALILAVPLALLSALYVSQFLHPKLRGHVKPAVEIMVALPSVVLGFIAGVWLAPAVERMAPGLLLAPLVTGATVLLAVLLWRRAPQRLRARLSTGMELLLILPVVLLGLWAALALGRWLEAGLMTGDYRAWMLRTLGVSYDQRNSLVVGLAMGFAVIPVIFTIAEDAFSNVPRQLSAGSLALGATPWQTACRIVIPTASPGVFSAIMIGFGRAVGETMIVLMATGNTPLMDPSAFNGFRALSANIAVELPEAPVGSTHYRVLFLAAFLLFLMTFTANTIAEVIRQRLRKRYQCL